VRCCMTRPSTSALPPTIAMAARRGLLDAGCGPGVLTVRLAHLFRQAVGLDPDADMLAESCRAAEEKES